MKGSIKFRTWLAVLGVALGGVEAGWATDTNLNHAYVFSITEENDLFTPQNSDKHYTQGLHFGLLWPDENPAWPMRPLSWLPDFGLADATHQYGLRFGQDMYTPTNLKTVPPDPLDRPYAGWLFLGFVRDDRGTVANGIPTRDHLEVDLGVVGPASLVSDTQIWWHQAIGSLQPVGWPYQIHNEPGFLISADRQLKIWDTSTGHFLQGQLLPHAGINLGNIETSLRLGSQLRVGHNIPDTFGKVRSSVFGAYLFSGVDGRAVGYNEFLDGNAFQTSRSVAKEPFVVEARGGFVLVLGHTAISYTYAYLTKEFKTQGRCDNYGSLNWTQTF